MTERRVSIDIQPKSNPSGGSDQNPQGPAENRLWTQTDNTFQFNFTAESNNLASTSVPLRTPPPVDPTGATVRAEGPASEFAFNFRIPAVTPEHMDTQGPTGASESEHSSQSGAQEPAPTVTQETRIPSEPPAQSKAQKKKKSGKKKKSTECPKSQENTSPSEGGHDPELTAESHLQRELDWCTEQLELGLRTQKGTPKQKEDTSRALKVLRSGKAPLAKKRQVMRAMTGDYRRRMAEEKEKQLKLIQSEMASLQVKAVSGSSKKKSVFHRRAGTKTNVVNAGEESKPQPPAPTSDQTQSDNKTTISQFVLTPSKEEFKFNFV